MEPARLAALAALVAALVVACGEEPTLPTSLTVSSRAFSSGGSIPSRHTCGGADVSPQLTWTGVPNSAQSVALTVIDPDAPGKPFVHWLIFNMPPTTADLPEGATAPAGAVQGRNDFGSMGYRGPCPPPGSPHHYHFKVYALDGKVSLPAGSSESSFEDAVKGHVLASGEIVGTFKR